MKNSSFGILSPVHLNAAGTNFDLNFLKFLTESNIKSLAIKTILEKSNKKDLIKVNFMNAAAWLVSAECLRKTGGFDSIFFHYGEDRNYAQRAIFHGFKIGVSTGDIVYHDRENRVVMNSNDPLADFRQMWRNFLINACNINQRSYVFFIFKEFLKHSAYRFKATILRNKARSNFHRLFNQQLLSSFKKIKKSRKESMSGNAFLYREGDENNDRNIRCAYAK